MDEKQILQRFQDRALGFMDMLGARFVAADPVAKTCAIEFNIGREFCHSGDVIQGGFITAMLDSAMTHAVFAGGGGITNLFSLEIKTSYLETARAGTLQARGSVVKSGYKLAFLEGRLYDAQDTLVATASSVAKLLRSDVTP